VVLQGQDCGCAGSGLWFGRVRIVNLGAKGVVMVMVMVEWGGLLVGY
jgi:hypothetical protein